MSHKTTTIRRCNGCGCDLPLTKQFFFARSDRASGFQSRCKDCNSAYRREVYFANHDEELKQAKARYVATDKDSLRARRRVSRAINRDAENARSKKWAEANRDKTRASVRRWKENNVERFRKYQARWAAENPERRVAAQKRYEQRHPDRIRAKSIRRNIERRNDPQQALHSRISRAIRKALRNGDGKGGRKWEQLVGYSRCQLMAHIERQFSQGMSWNRYLSGDIHIDHIRPASSFEFSTATDPGFIDCWSLTNLRPLWAHENQTKHAKRVMLL